MAATFGFVPGLMMGFKKGWKVGNETLILLLILITPQAFADLIATRVVNVIT
jgi:hypothetical protein